MAQQYGYEPQESSSSGSDYASYREKEMVKVIT